MFNAFAKQHSTSSRLFPVCAGVNSMKSSFYYFKYRRTCLSFAALPLFPLVANLPFSLFLLGMEPVGFNSKRPVEPRISRKKSSNGALLSGHRHHRLHHHCPRQLAHIGESGQHRTAEESGGERKSKTTFSF